MCYVCHIMHTRRSSCQIYVCLSHLTTIQYLLWIQIQIQIQTERGFVCARHKETLLLCDYTGWVDLCCFILSCSRRWSMYEISNIIFLKLTLSNSIQWPLNLVTRSNFIMPYLHWNPLEPIGTHCYTGHDKNSVLKLRLWNGCPLQVFLLFFDILFACSISWDHSFLLTLLCPRQPPFYAASSLSSTPIAPVKYCMLCS